MPSSEFAQKEVGVITRFADVVKHGGAAQLAGIVDQQVTKAEDSLRNTRRHGHVLNFRERNISRSPGDQSGVDLYFGVCERVANQVALQVVKRRDE